APHGLRTLLADQVFKIPQSHVRVVTGEVGGSFGMKSGVYPEVVLVLWAAKRLGRPVKWTSDRREGFVTDEHGRDNVSTAELALDANGKFLALRVAINLNIGAYFTPRSAGPGTNNVGGIAGIYTTPVIHVQTTGVFSNTTPTGPYRGAGRPEATYAIERVIDVAAHELGIDPIELRRRNLIPSSAMPFKTGLLFTYDCGDFARGMEMALKLADRSGFEKRRVEARQRGKLRGLARDRESHRARAADRCQAARGRAGRYRAPRRQVHGDRHRPRRDVRERRARRLRAAPAPPGHGAGLQRGGRVHAPLRHVPQRLADLRSRDRRGHRRRAHRAPLGRRRRRQDGQSDAREGPDPRRRGAGPGAGTLRGAH